MIFKQETINFKWKHPFKTLWASKCTKNYFKTQEFMKILILSIQSGMADITGTSCDRSTSSIGWYLGQYRTWNQMYHISPDTDRYDMVWN